MSITATPQELIWTPEASEPPLYLAGPSHSSLVEKGDDDSAQFIKSGIGPLYFGDANAGQKISFCLRVGAGAQFYHPTFTPEAHIDSNGKIVLKGTATQDSKSLTVGHFLSGTPDGECMYIVLDITNNSEDTAEITPALILADVNLQNFRWKDFGVTGNDSISIDGTNDYVQISSSGISNIFVGVKACTTTQHFDAQQNWQDVASILASGDFDDTVGTVGTNNYIWVEYGEVATPTEIAAGATARFVWAIAYKTSQAALQTFMGALDEEPTSELATADGYFTKTRLGLNIHTQFKLALLWGINLGRLGFQAYFRTIDSLKNNPAGSYTFLHPFGRDGYYSAKAMLQIADGDEVVADEIALFKSYENTDNSQEHEVAQYVNATGRYITSSNNGAPGDQDCYQILKAYEYYISTQDDTWLGNNISSLNDIADYLKDYYDTHDKWSDQFAGNGTSTYLDGDGNITGENPMHDPVMSSLVAYTMYRLAELNTLEGNAAEATTYTEFADAITNGFEGFWNSETDWLDFNVKTDGTAYDNIHLTKVDAGLWGVLDQEKCKTMCSKIIDGETFWDDTNKQFRLMPEDDALFDAGSYWYGNGWNMVDFKALEFVFRYGTRAQAKQAWEYLNEISGARINKIHGFMAEKWDNSGVFGFAIGAMVEMMVRGLYGIDMHAEHFTINPNTNKLGITDTFELTNLRMGNKTWNVRVTGAGAVKTVYVDGNLLPSDEIPYTAGSSIRVVYSGRKPL